MKKIFRFMVFTVVALGLLLALATVGLKIYFNESRLRDLVLPPLQEACGRDVAIGSIAIDLFRGVTVKGLVVKENDGRTDFLVVREISLGYNLWPLLEKRLEISRVAIDRPLIKVRKKSDGSFNFSDLAFLRPSKASSPPASDEAPAGGSSRKSAALPFALLVQNLEVADLRFFFADDGAELPKVELSASLRSQLDLKDLRPESIDASGELSFALTAEKDFLKPRLNGKVTFNRKLLDVQALCQVEGQELKILAQLRDFLSSLPRLRLDLEADKLDLALLAGLGAKLSPPAAPAAAPAKTSPPAPTSAPPAPPALEAAGHLRIGEAVYSPYRVKDLEAVWEFKHETLRLTELAGIFAGGRLAGQAELNPFRQKPRYSGEFEFDGLGFADLSAMAAPALEKNLSGQAYGNFSFRGQGFDEAGIKQNLSLNGVYGCRQAALKDLPLTRALAAILGLPSLNNLALADLEGNLRLTKGLIDVNSSWQGSQIKGQATGKIGLDGGLDLPLKLVLSPELSRQLAGRYPWLESTYNERGEAALGLALKGSLSAPRFKLDEKDAGRRLQKTLEKKLLEKLEEKQSGRSDAGTGSREQKKPDAKELLKRFIAE